MLILFSCTISTLVDFSRNFFNLHDKHLVINFNFHFHNIFIEKNVMFTLESDAAKVSFQLICITRSFHHALYTYIYPFSSEFLILHSEWNTIIKVWIQFIFIRKDSLSMWMRNIFCCPVFICNTFTEIFPVVQIHCQSRLF